MRKLDKLVLTTFFPPLVLTYFIATFILVMQFLWVYVDDLIGKGLEFYILLELLYYASVSMFPMALPLAVLLSSIMTFGSLGEHSELVAIKANGVSLLKTMRGMFIAIFGIALFAIFIANSYLPYVNKNFWTLLSSIREQRPAFNIKEKAFYNEIEGISIKANRKAADNKTLYDVLIYDHSGGRGNLSVLHAKKGEVFMSDNKLFLTLRLYDGMQYEELTETNRKDERTYPHTQTKFRVWERVIDMSEFAFNKMDEDYYKDVAEMLSIGQLADYIDSNKKTINKRKDDLLMNIYPYYTFIRQKPDSSGAELVLSEPDSFLSIEENDTVSILSSFELAQQSDIVKNALGTAKVVKQFIAPVERDIENRKKHLRYYEIELHRKFTVAVSCIVLFLVGAPLGAYIKKGGLGVSIVISTILFIAFYLISITGEKMAKQTTIDLELGMWLANLIVFPVSLFLTIKITNETAMFELSTYLRPIKKFLKLN